MIYVDANVFLRALTRSPEPRVQRMNDIAGNLLRAAERGEVELTTSDAVIAAVAFILTAKAHYHLPVSDAAARLATLVRLQGVNLPNKESILAALELWAERPKLGFVDALVASQSKHQGSELATFDAAIASLPDVVVWQPPAMETETTGG